ncbi:MAG: acetyl-CoA carboxylase biotin carboxyl carrier protein [Acidobacteriaceae bacterium]|nr:acetyl-CoA carboxylase biotin carboxyl carrier protein [Acidobacteriaceae bacterium]
MDPNTLKELSELVDFLKANGIAEFDMEQADMKVRLKFAGASVAAPVVAANPAPAAAPAVVSAPVAAVPAEEKLHEVKSPIVGTFYESPGPGTPPFVQIGDRVEVGQVLCIVEAMKLMNEIEADVAGEVVRRIAVSGQPVEYGAPLFAIRPR